MTSRNKYDTLSFIKRAKEIHGNLFVYDEVVFINTLVKVWITCTKCNTRFNQIPKTHLKGGGCWFCRNRKTTQDFIKEAKLIHKEKYNYDHVVYINNQTKVKIFCNTHGEFFEQIAAEHTRGQGKASGCPKCGLADRYWGIEDILEKFKNTHGEEYDYSKMEYKTVSKNINIIHKKCGREFAQQPILHYKGHGCLHCYKESIKLSLAQFIEYANKKHEYEYSYDEVSVYTNNTKKVKIYHKKCGRFFEQRAGTHLAGSGCPLCNSRRGVYYSTKMKAEIIYDSLYEKGRMLQYDLNLYVNSWSRCKDIIPYVDKNGKERKYHPDFELIYDDKIVIEEIKGETDETLQCKMDAAIDFYRKQNKEFRLVGKNKSTDKYFILLNPTNVNDRLMERSHINRGYIMKLDELKKNNEAPQWLTIEGYRTLQGGYLLNKETPRQMYMRIAKKAASFYSNSDTYEQQFFDIMWKNWLCPSSPILSNLGADRGLPISCNTIHIDDSLDSIFMKNYELAILSKNGAGVGVYFGDLRGRGEPIKNGLAGVSDGVIGWARLLDTTTTSVSQGSRRGATAIYLPIEHPDLQEFIMLRRPTGDTNTRCPNINIGVCITNKWMEELIAGDKKKRQIWQMLLLERAEVGEPYIFFTDNVNEQNPQCYKDKGLTVKASNLCSEICLYTDSKNTFSCCLASVNLVRWDEWKDTDLINLTTRFLDAVLSEYIIKSENMRGMEAARRSALAGRPIGIGVLGWHSLLQENMIPFDSFEAMKLNGQIHRKMREDFETETAILAKELGEPEICVGYNRRNSHGLAIAPTVSNSLISGSLSAGIEPIAANYWVQKSAKGTFIRKNPTLEKLLEEKGKNVSKVWKSINAEKGSVQHLDFLSDHEREVFLTAREINQFALIKQAAQRQKYIDQSQSLNLFFAANADPKYIHQVHLEAWKSGLKTLYYFRSEGVLRGDLASRSSDECKACEG